MTIASLNINGLRSHLDEVQLLIRSLGIHILALNETKLDPHYPKELTSLPGYQQERQIGHAAEEVFLFISGTPLNISFVLMFLLMIWKPFVLRLTHQKANLFLFLLGTGHLVTLLLLLISLKRPFPI